MQKKFGYSSSGGGGVVEITPVHAKSVLVGILDVLAQTSLRQNELRRTR